MFMAALQSFDYSRISVTRFVVVVIRVGIICTVFMAALQSLEFIVVFVLLVLLLW